MYNETVTLFKNVNGIWNAYTFGGVQCVNYTEETEHSVENHCKVYFVPGRYRIFSDIPEISSGDMLCAGNHTDYLPSPRRHRDVHAISRIFRFPLDGTGRDVVIAKT